MIRRLLLALGLIAAAAPAYAVCTLPVTLVNGTLADAGQVMADLNALLTCINNSLGAGVTGPASSTVGHYATFGNTSGNLLADTAASQIGLPHNVADTNLYVSKTGVDSGSCQVIGSPCVTISYALTQGLFSYVGGGNLVVNFQGAGTWAEDVFINGPLFGSVNKTGIPNIGTVWPSMVVLNGNGSANTILAGSGSVCGTVVASQYGIIGVENIKLTGNATGCQSTLFAQLGGIIHVFGGVNLGAASQQQVHAEDSGSMIEFWQAYTISGGATSFIAVGSNANVKINAGVGTLTGTPAFSTAFVFAQGGGNVQWNIVNPWTGAATGQRFTVISNGSIETQGDISTIPGSTLGVVSSGGHYRGPLVATIGSSSGLGTGSAALAAGSTPEAGLIVLSPTGAPGSSGTQNVTLPYIAVTSSGALGFCTAGPGQGTGSWNTGAVLVTNYSSGNLGINWNNNGTNLAAGSTYFIPYGCSGI